MARPFEGLPAETDWVALREIVPAATMTVPLRADAQSLIEASAASDGPLPATITVATVLPLAWPGLHRNDGELLVGLQSGATTGDASRDVAHVLLGLLGIPAGRPVPAGRPADAETPRLQDLLDLDADVEVTMYEDFDFWVADDVDLTGEAQESLQQASESIIPTVKLEAAQSAYWCRVGDRTHLRWILPHDEDRATDALARLHSRDADSLGDGTRLLGAFRACGLLVPVWDLDPARDAADYETPVASVAQRFGEALADESPLTPQERRARSGLLSRQLTLR